MDSSRSSILVGERVRFCFSKSPLSGQIIKPIHQVELISRIPFRSAKAKISLYISVSVASGKRAVDDLPAVARAVVALRTGCSAYIRSYQNDHIK